MSLRIIDKFYNKLYFLRNITRNSDCNKRGQTSRPVAGTEIQTSCNFKANLRDRYYPMAFARCLFNNVLLESSYNLLVRHHLYIAVSYNLDFLYPPSISKSSTRPFSTAQPNKSTELGAIQKGSSHCNMVATDAVRLLSSSECSNCFDGWTIFISFSR